MARRGLGIYLLLFAAIFTYDCFGTVKPRTKKQPGDSRFILRKVMARDLPQISAIQGELGLKPAISLNGYVLEKNGLIAGFLLYSEEGNTVSIDSIGVRPDFQREHVGTQLANEVIHDLNKQNYVALTAKVDSQDPIAKRFFESLGLRKLPALATSSSSLDTYEFRPKLPELNVDVEWMVRRDLKTVLEIEQRAFGAAHAWGEEDFLSWLRRRDSIGMVARHEGEVVGYMVYQLQKDSVQIVNFAVDPKLHRKDIGEQLISKLKHKIVQQERTRILAPVSTSNSSALRFFTKMGFGLGSAFEAGLQEHGEEAVLLEYRLGSKAFSQDVLRDRNLFDRLNVHLLTPREDIFKSREVLKLAYALSPESVALLDEAVSILTDPQKRREYLNSHIAELKNLLATPNKRGLFPAATGLYERLALNENDWRSESIALREEAGEILYRDNPELLQRHREAVRVLGNRGLRDQYDAILSTTEGVDQEQALLRFLAGLDQPPRETNANLKPDTSPYRGTPYQTVRPYSRKLYQRMGVSENATRDTIIGAYIELMRTKKFNSKQKSKIAEAYDVLTGPLRSAYDSLLQQGSKNYDEILAETIRRSRLHLDPKEDSPQKVPELYQRLGVFENASSDFIDNNFLIKLREPNLPAQVRSELREAYAVLSNPDFRRKYDELCLNPDSSSVAQQQKLAELIKAAVHSPKSDFEVGRAAFVDLYGRLQAPNNSSPERLENAFLEQVAQATGEKAQEIVDAYAVLKYPKLRSEYDAMVFWGKRISAPMIREWVIRSKDLDYDLQFRGAAKPGAANLLTLGERFLPLVTSRPLDSKRAKLLVSRLEDELKKVDWSNHSLMDFSNTVALVNHLRAQPDYSNSNFAGFRARLLELRAEIAQSLLQHYVKNQPALEGFKELFAHPQPNDLVGKLALEHQRKLPSVEPLTNQSPKPQPLLLRLKTAIQCAFNKLKSKNK